MNREEIIYQMKERVYQGNLTLPKWGLVKLTWGNVSEVNRELGVIVIKPSGVDYGKLTANDMVVTDLEGHVLDEDGLRPSSDLKTHVVLYQSFDSINSVVHTHSTNSVGWAQSGRNVPVYGTTHADAFYGEVPNTRFLTEKEVNEDYERNTGLLIVETVKERDLNPESTPGILVNGHGPFTWGASVGAAVENSLILDEICAMATLTELNQKENYLPNYIMDKHYFRKHGENAYYGQK